jgi:CelD/BcsL family acetyltransferase involved in cellulose biosynthesis
MARSIQLPIRFAIGDWRFLTLRIEAAEIGGHFLEQPASLTDLLAARETQPARHAVFGRSILASHDELIAAMRRGVPLRILAEYERHYVRLGGTFDEYLAKFSSRSRSTLTRKVRKFKEASGGVIDWSTFRTPSDVRPFLSEALPLSALTYQHRLIGSGLPATDGFRERTEALAAGNRFRGWVLRFDSRAIAYIWSEIVGTTVLYDYVGFDPARSDLSPGTVLQYLVLEQLFEERAFQYFDFTEGEGSHKQFFGTGSCHCADVLIPGTALGPRFTLASQQAFSKGMHFAARAAERAGMKARLRRLLRGTS